MAKTVKKNEAKAKETAAPKKSVVENVVAESKQDEKVISLESAEKIESTDVSEIINNETTEEFTNLNTEIVEEGIVNLEGETKDESETLNETEDTQSETTDESSDDDQPQETPVEEYASLPEDIWVDEPVTLDPTIFERIPVYPITPKYTACPPTALTKVSPSDTPKYNAQCPPKPDTEKAKSYVAQRPY